MLLSGCKVIKTGNDKIKDLDFALVEEKDIPKELKKLIDEKKDNTVRLTYSTKDYTYLVAGYGAQPTSGYSIRVDNVYLGTNAIVVDVCLLGPAVDQAVTELPTTPYIVLKIEKREEQVIYQM